MSGPGVTETVEQIAREAYGRLLARLARRFRDIAAAEDALGDALAIALERWPNEGLPASPEAWLTTVAKNQVRQRLRQQATARAPATTRTLLELGAEAALSEQPTAGDERLDLMLVCAHPAIDPSLHVPLMLQTVLGLDARRIARLFLVPAATMSQRLVRGKQKIRDGGIPFERPHGRALGERLDAVLEGLYAAFGAETDAVPAAQAADSEPGAALFLARVLAEQLPEEPEVLGLFALMRLSHARSAARFEASGAFVPLPEQDPARWDREAIVEAERTLLRAASLRRPGPYQLEAAIQSAHCQRLFTGSTPWRAIATLYEHLNRLAPTTGRRVAQAAAQAEVGELAAARATLTELDSAAVENYAPFWVVRAHVAELSGDRAAADDALRAAIATTADPRLQAHLERRLVSSSDEGCRGRDS